MVVVTEHERYAPDLSPSELIRAGGWHPDHARVLRIERVGEVALVVIDGNGNGAELEQEAWIRSPQGWQCASSTGIGPLGSPGWAAGTSCGLVWAAGTAPAGTTVVVEYRNERHSIQVDENGLWIFAGHDDEPELLDHPRLLS